MKAEVHLHTIRELTREGGVLDALNDRARVLWRTATLLAPRRSGAYLASLRVRRARPSSRPVAMLIADDHKAVWIEYGTGRPAPTPHFEVLRRSVRTNRNLFVRVEFASHALKGPRGRR